MKGKADMLVAHRSLSALVAVCLVISAFAGLLFLANPGPTRAQAPIGDLIVTGAGTHYAIDGIVQPVDGNVTVSAGGHLTVQDATLSVISNYAPSQRHHITVTGATSTLTLTHGTITTYLDQITPWPFLDILVDAGTLEATGDSILMFPGHITLTNGAVVTLTDTQIMALPGSEVAKYVVGSSGLITQDSADDGPAISITSSAMKLFDSSILNLPEFPGDHVIATNITISGDSVLLAVNSYIDVDFGPVRTSTDYYQHNAIKISGTSRAELYGCWFESYVGIEADRAPAIEAGGQAYVAIPSSKGGEDTTGQSISQIQQSDDGSSYHVAPGTLMAIDGFSAGPVVPIDGATLIVRYMVNSGYNGDRFVTWSTNEGVTTTSTGIRPLASDLSYVEKSYDLYAAGVTTIGALTSLDVNFLNSGTTGDVQFDSMSIVISIGAQAHIYRWLNVTIGDEYGVPIPGASVSAAFTGSEEYGGQPSLYFSIDGAAQPFPPTDVLDYMGKTTASFATTENDGIARIPFLTDLVSGGSPNSLFVGSFSLTGTATIPGRGVYASTEAFSFSAYPAMGPENRQSDVTVELQGVSAPSPDTSRWLVVPVNATVPSLTISDMSYYHAGDVIVAANGTLLINNAVFELVQSHDNERTVYVDGTVAYPATLIFENSVMTSQKKVDIVVKGDATLMVLNSTLEGVNIVALERSHVMFRNANMSGSITTAWDSEATIDIRDSILDTTPVLSGSAEGSFTNCSVPSITVQDDAVAYIYRWIHVTVLDGAGKPMSGVNVTARNYVDGTYMNSAITSSQIGQLGVAKVNSKGTIITSSGSTFVGNYKVNATYTWGGEGWWADETSVGVRPYTEPLGKNATYATMTIDEAFPDLTIPSNGVSINRTYPMKAQSTMVTANVSNIGMSTAFDVSVEFYDVSKLAPLSAGSPFATVIVPVILPGTTIPVQAIWSPGLPVFPDPHSITVIADRQNTVRELNESEAKGVCSVMIQSLPDPEIRSGAAEIYTSPSYVIVGEPVTIFAYVYNIGDNDTLAFDVEFRDGTTLIGSRQVTLAPGASQLVSIPYVYASTGTYKLEVLANYTFAELEDGNNKKVRDITVLDHPDLSLSSLQFYATNGALVSSIPGGNMVKASAWLRNVNPAPFSNPTLNLYASYAGDPTLQITGTARVDQVLSNGVPATFVTISFPAPDKYPGTIVLSVRMIVNEARSPTESDYSNNEVTADLIVLDVRADLAISASDIKVQHVGLAGNITSEMFGKQVKVVVTVHNLGGREVSSFRLEIRVQNDDGYDISLSLINSNVSRNATDNFVKVTYLWTINLTTPGLYRLNVSVDPSNQIAEPNENNNIAETNFTLEPLKWKATVIPSDGTEFKAGDTILLVVTIKYNDSSLPVRNLPGVQVWLANANTPGVKIDGSGTTILKTDGDGQLKVAEMLAPTTLSTGMYNLMVNVTDAGAVDSGTQVHVSEVVSGGLFPWWVWALIIGSVVGVVAGFTVYTYVFGLGKLVECGECGAFIPAASKRCPKCGVEFEVGTMKCSECGAWIPAESTECPNCGVKFVGETEGEADYLERMKKEYDDMLSKYRELAKGELGKKFSDREFESWWKRQPGYISFDDWLAKEEEKKKEGPVPCPACGTLNPKEATVCHKCGTVFGTAQAVPQMVRKGPPPASPGQGPTAVPQQRVVEQPQEQEPVQQAAPSAAPRMVIRRPIDRKVVPKKIIKTPVAGEETQEGSQDNNEGQQ